MLISTQLYHVDLSDNSSKGWKKPFFLCGYFTKPSLLDGEVHEGKSFIFKVLFLHVSFIAVRGRSHKVAILIVLLKVVALIPASCTAPLSLTFFSSSLFFCACQDLCVCICKASIKQVISQPDEQLLALHLCSTRSFVCLSLALEFPLSEIKFNSI
jgi:hypothetical protein